MDDYELIKLALLIANVGGFKDYLASDTGRGFRLREHDADRNKPFSPFFFDLHTQDNEEPGPLTSEIVHLVGKKLAELVLRQGLLKKHTHLAGLPSAGTPFAKALIEALPSGVNTTPINIIKRPIGDVGKEYRFKLEGRSPPTGTPVLLIDDLASTDNRKLRAAALLREYGLVVTDYVVLIDRRRRSVRENDIGLTCHSLFKVEEMVSVYRKFGIFKNPEIPNIILSHILS